MTTYLYDSADPTSTYDPLWTLDDVHAELHDLMGLAADGFQPELGIRVDLPFLVARCYEEVPGTDQFPQHWRRRQFIPEETITAMIIALAEEM